MNPKVIWLSGIFGALAVGAGIIAAASVGGSTIGNVSTVVLLGALAFLLQWLAFIPAFIFQTEKFFDLMGSVTFIAVALTALLLSDLQAGTVAIALMVVIWAGRLGSFLFLRIHRDGEDKRFRSIKPDFLQFLMTWTIQGLWVVMTLSAGLAAMTSGREHPVDAFVIAGVVLWCIGFVIEVLADRQKSAFRSKPENANRFIQEGLWAMSRHPNYFGEILLWLGIAVVALPVLQGWQYVTLVSPVFVYVLLTRISGVRMLEHRAKKQWGDDPEFKAYLKRTPVLLLNPMLARSQSSS